MASSIFWTGNRTPDPVAGRQTQTAAQRTGAQTALRQQVTAPEPAAQTVPPEMTGLVIPMQTDPDTTDIGTTRQGPPPSTEPGFIPYYLTQNIGKNVRAEFIIGSDQYADKTGKLIEVGINYFVLEDVNSRTHIMCDLYSVKFVTVLQDFGS